MGTNGIESVVFGGGCFWCTEAIFKELRGVVSVIPGYAGGTTANPTYESVCTGKTGHVEVVKVDFHPEQISFHDLLTVFFATHDPTSLDRQGADTGTEYRSAIFYTNDGQKKEIAEFIKKLNQSDLPSQISPGETREGKKGRPVVTEVKPLEKFYEAEMYHRSYFASNPDQPYCQIIIEPKVQKLQKEFAQLLKEKGK